MARWYNSHMMFHRLQRLFHSMKTQEKIFHPVLIDMLKLELSNDEYRAIQCALETYVDLEREKYSKCSDDKIFTATQLKIFTDFQVL